jgi:hypothetical protein
MLMSDEERLASIERSRAWMGERGADLAGKGDRYTPSGGVRHRTRPNFLETSTLVADCGLSANESYWRGTGSQDEYERLAAMPRCTRCITAAGPSPAVLPEQEQQL